MKKVLTIILLISFVVCLTACGNTSSNNLSEEQIRKIVQEEIAKVEQPSVDTDEITNKVLARLKEQEQIHKIVEEEIAKIEQSSVDTDEIANKVLASLNEQEQIRKIVEEEIAKVEQPSVDTDEITNKVLASLNEQEQIRKIVEEEIAKVEQPTVDVDEITKNVLSALKKENEFVVGEQLSNLLDLPMAFSYGENTEINVQEYTITKTKASNPREKGDFVYDFPSGYVFYRYQYKITVQGKADAQYAGTYIRIGYKVMNGSLSVSTYFDGNLWEEGLNFSGGYDFTTNKTVMGGCVCKIQLDGSFKGEMDGYSDDNLDEFIITGVGGIY